MGYQLVHESGGMYTGLYRQDLGLHTFVQIIVKSGSLQQRTSLTSLYYDPGYEASSFHAIQNFCTF